MVERLNQTIENFLVKHEMKDTDWSKLVGSACFAYHTHMHKATGYTPARLFLGWDLVPPIVQAYKLKALRKVYEEKQVDGDDHTSEDIDTDKVYLDETGECKYSADKFMDLDYDNKLETIKNLHVVIKEKAKENITKCQALYKKYYDKKHEDILLKVGDWVFVREVKRGRLTKKKNKWKGDYFFPTPFLFDFFSTLANSTSCSTSLLSAFHLDCSPPSAILFTCAQSQSRSTNSFLVQLTFRIPTKHSTAGVVHANQVKSCPGRVKQRT